MINIESAKVAFDDFVSKYDISDERIKLKYDHTYRVCEQSLKISESIGLDDENTNLSFLIALLHDIGRFEQARLYNTFNDSKSVDHAFLGCKLLFEDGLIRKFVDDDSYDEIIRKAIYNHNKYEIGVCNDMEMLHSKIIRDADKIDIMNLVVNLGEIKLSDDSLGVSKKVDESFRNHLSISHKDKLARNDSIIMMLAFVFDLNFDYSYRYYKDNNYIDLFYSKLKNKDIFSEYIEIANGYIEGKCNNVRTKIYS